MGERKVKGPWVLPVHHGKCESPTELRLFVIVFSPTNKATL